MDREAGVMVCREAGDVYATAEPAAAFHQRTAFCLDIHNEVRHWPPFILLETNCMLRTALPICTCTAGCREHNPVPRAMVLPHVKVPCYAGHGHSSVAPARQMTLAFDVYMLC